MFYSSALFVDFSHFFTATKVAKDGDLTSKKVGHFFLDKYHKMLTEEQKATSTDVAIVCFHFPIR